MNICEIAKVAHPYQTFHRGKNGTDVYMFTKDGSSAMIDNDDCLVFPEKIDKNFLFIDNFEFVE